ncbi:hypothetical protein LX32DRAFT_163577 [Colletotrichum zoysiae]|uniref:Uncharacterized protein n=1 Tax=Colletotrichum zoysiae TaxID=1216348 RepID=A0AAD9H7S3_9PEZI|nr:hypothetical protein LX32DRAFT_163577 [Colletotrichum zoysiae]
MYFLSRAMSYVASAASRYPNYPCPLRRTVLIYGMMSLLLSTAVNHRRRRRRPRRRVGGRRMVGAWVGQTGLLPTTLVYSLPQRMTLCVFAHLSPIRCMSKSGEDWRNVP